MENNEIVSFEKNKKKSKLLLILLSVVLIVIASVVIIYFYINSNPLLAIKYNANKLTKNITEEIEQQEKIKKISGNLEIDYNIESSDETLKEMIDAFNGISVSANYKMDTENKILQTELKTTYKNEKLIDANIYMQDKQSFVQLPGVFDKYINIDLSEDYDDIFNKTKNTKESKTIVKSVNKAFQKSLKKEYLKSENKTITIDDKKTKTTKISMELNDEKLAKISKDFLTSLKDDQEFIKASNSISENKNTKEEIENLIDEISFDNQSNTTMTLSIYCKGILKEVVRYEVELKQDEETYNIIITKQKDKYDIKIKQEDVIISKGTIAINKKEKITIEVSLIGLGNATINITNKEEKNPTINKKEINDSIKYEELTEKQMQDITTKLSQNKGFEKLATIFESLMSPSY
jgi:hypothetical protein